MDLTIEGKAYINGTFETCCIGVNQGKICAIKKILKGDAHLKFDRKLILPAGVDIHVHFRDPGFIHKEDFSTGSKAAAFGGITCVFDMPNTIPQTTTLQHLSDKIVSSRKKAYVDFGIYAGITDTNIKDIEALAQTCSGFKIYLGSSTNSLLLDKRYLNEAFRNIYSTGKPVLVHAEDESCLMRYGKQENNIADHLRCRPVACEETAIKEVIAASRDVAPKIHICHISSCDGLELLRNQPKNISCGVTPHHLLLSTEEHLKPESHYKVNPPLRTVLDKEALFDGIRNGSVDVIESDHAPHTLEEKDTVFNNTPAGLPGVETM